MALCSRGDFSGGGQRFLYEVRPDVFPQGFLTKNELMLWNIYYQNLNDKRPKRGGR
jgi:hypothetical protein